MTDSASLGTDPATASPIPKPTADAQVHAGSLADLATRGRKVVKAGRKQIALFHSPKGVFACNNRCPHEGYPLVEGSLAEGCILTCNWHNWKFDLEGGETLVGGDTLRRYPVKIDGDDVWVDVSDPPAAERAQAALDNLRASFRRHEYDRMAREIARLQLADADPLDAVRAAIAWTYDRLEFGTTHAHAAAPDWLALRSEIPTDEAERLVPLVEIVGNLAWDTLREPAYPYPDGKIAFDPDALVQAIEIEDEAAATALVRGALDAGLGFAALERPLATAALAHYQDFGHSAIYLYKTGQLIERLGASVAEPLLLALTRSLIYASREDLIPEFRDYGPSVQAWDGTGARRVTAEDFKGLSVRQALDRSVETSADVPALYDALMGIGAWNMLHYDMSYQAQTTKPVSQNIGWLDFTHHITFANAARALATTYPDLWPQTLLQMACFTGRNAAFTDTDIDGSEWRITDTDAFLREQLAGLFDHAQQEYIVSVHLVKVLVAVREEITNAPNAPWVPTLLAATNRFLHAPLKRKHATRVARQALAFTELEG